MQITKSSIEVWPYRDIYYQTLTSPITKWFNQLRDESVWNVLSLVHYSNDYSGDLKFKLVLILNGQKEAGLQMVWILNGVWNPEAQPFEIWTNGRLFVKNHLKFGQKWPNFEWSGFWMVGTIAMAASIKHFCYI